MTEKESRPAGNGAATSERLADGNHDTAPARHTDRATPIERGRAIVESGVHAPPATIYTADEHRIWFDQPANVISLDEFRRRRARSS